MGDDFKRKLEAYEKGELTGSELNIFEKELEKLEQYQEILEKDDGLSENESIHNDKRQRKILRWSKWKARLQTAFFALLMFILITIISSIITSIYYGWGSPNRIETFGHVIDHTLTITDPYGYIGGTSFNSSPFFSTTGTRDLNKSIGDETVQVGELEIKFIFSNMGYPEEKNFGRTSQHRPGFVYPNGEFGFESDWNQLEKLPKGTVVSAYISFDDLMETKDVFDVMEDRDLELIWLATDTGLENQDKWAGAIHEPIGFPNFPIWHDDDMILQSREEDKKGRVISEGYSSPEYREGDTDILHEQFLKTLHFLKDHERKANQLYFFGHLELDERIRYFENHGFKHYGIVVTGPTKEVLKLKEESWVNVLQVDEVGFWNWHDFR